MPEHGATTAASGGAAADGGAAGSATAPPSSETSLAKLAQYAEEANKLNKLFAGMSDEEIEDFMNGLEDSDKTVRQGPRVVILDGAPPMVRPD